MRYATINASALEYLHRIMVHESPICARIFNTPIICIGRDKSVTGALLARLAPRLRKKHIAQVEARIKRSHVSSLLTPDL